MNYFQTHEIMQGVPSSRHQVEMRRGTQHGCNVGQGRNIGGHRLCFTSGEIITGLHKLIIGAPWRRDQPLIRLLLDESVLTRLTADPLGRCLPRRTLQHHACRLQVGPSGRKAGQELRWSGLSQVAAADYVTHTAVFSTLKKYSLFTTLSSFF